MASRPLEIVSIDFLKLDRGSGGFEDVLVFTDVFTKLALAVACRDQTAPNVAKVLLDKWIYVYGMPQQLHSDQGRNFEGKLIHELCLLLGVKKSRTTPYYPSGNPVTERFNKTLCTLIRSLEPSTRLRWPTELQSLVYIYNTTPHATTGFSPYKMMFGREPSIGLDQILGNCTQLELSNTFVITQSQCFKRAYEVAQREIEISRVARKKRDENLARMSPPLSVGDLVLLKRQHFEGRHKLEDLYFPDPYIISDVNVDGDVYKIKPLTGTGKSKWVNRRSIIDDLRAFVVSSDNEGESQSDSDDDFFPIECDPALFEDLIPKPPEPEPQAESGAINRPARRRRPNYNPTRRPMSVLEEIEARQRLV